jgi:hypothetical protein
MRATTEVFGILMIIFGAPIALIGCALLLYQFSFQDSEMISIVFCAFVGGVGFLLCLAGFAMRKAATEKGKE